jgi:hypothetical protein
MMVAAMEQELPTFSKHLRVTPGINGVVLLNLGFLQQPCDTYFGDDIL